MKRDPTSSEALGSVCGLCNRPAKLCKSHILPKMAYKDVVKLDSHPRMVVVRSAAKGRVSEMGQQTGFWERLLCNKCEGRFSKYETYAAHNFFSANFQLPKSIADRTFTFDVGDYQSFKLFLMSLLWRVGVASGSFFRCVNLGPHQERLRVMLDAEDPGEPDEYGCLITPLLPEAEIPIERTVAMPGTTRVDGHNGCLLAFGGFVFQYFISRHGIHPEVKRWFIDKNGQLTMMWARIGQFKPLRELLSGCISAIQREARE